MLEPPFRIALSAAFAAAVLAVVPTAALAGKPGSRTCTRNAPSISAENTWAWSSTGSFGMPGQRLGYQLRIVDNDVGCSASSFTIGLSAPSGFSVSIPTSTISLKSTTQGYLWASVTSPTGAGDGDYPLALTVQRGGTADPPASSTTYYKVYSSDTVAPTLFWPNPGEGQTITGRSFNVAVSANDDHAVKQIDIYIDNVYKSTSLCDDISYNCHAAYTWNTSSGQHTATFEATDWMGKVGVMTVNFTVG
jgi:hypothetical protein